MKLTVDFRDEKTILRLEKLGLTITKSSLRGVDRATEFVRGKVVKALDANTYGLKTDTGTLKRSIFAKSVLKPPTTLLGQVGTNVVYAKIHETGGTILPKNKLYLKFPINGQWVTVKKVKVKPKWYMRKSLVNNIKSVKNIILFWIDKGWKK